MAADVRTIDEFIRTRTANNANSDARTDITAHDGIIIAAAKMQPDLTGVRRIERVIEERRASLRARAFLALEDSYCNGVVTGAVDLGIFGIIRAANVNDTRYTVRILDRTMKAIANIDIRKAAGVLSDLTILNGIGNGGHPACKCRIEEDVI